MATTRTGDKAAGRLVASARRQKDFSNLGVRVLRQLMNADTLAPPSRAGGNRVVISRARKELISRGKTP